MINYFMAKITLKTRGFSETASVVLDGEINFDVCVSIERDEPLKEESSIVQLMYQLDAQETINLNCYRLLDQLYGLFDHYCSYTAGTVRIHSIALSEEKIPQDAVIWKYDEQAIRELSDELGVRLIAHYFQEMEERYFDDDEQ